MAQISLQLLELDTFWGTWKLHYNLTVQVIGWTVGAIIIGALLYPLLMISRERKWCRFVGISPHEYKEVWHLLLLSVRSLLEPISYPACCQWRA